jgi:hypothetical protein
MPAAARKVTDVSTLSGLEAALGAAENAHDSAVELRDQLEAKLASERATRDEAQQKFDDLNTTRPDLLRSGDDVDVEANDAEIVCAQRALDRSAARITALEAELPVAQEREATAARQVRRAAAQISAANAPELLSMYDTQAQALATTVRRLREICAQVGRANAERAKPAEIPRRRETWVGNDGREAAGPGPGIRRGHVVDGVDVVSSEALITLPGRLSTTKLGEVTVFALGRDERPLLEPQTTNLAGFFIGGGRPR